ncbi:MAG: hypothetical protein BVN32_12890 [Proteobacteria bacterium ST_bin14]|nr:MAG: hypothetical protein BVN32_12890 [Proteobacteria bacterium ST_bin14]
MPDQLVGFGALSGGFRWVLPVFGSDLRGFGRFLLDLAGFIPSVRVYGEKQALDVVGPPFPARSAV